jgi:hypothetical protein
MASVALTDITLRKLTAPEIGQIEIWDSKLPGFGVRMTSVGTKSFVLVYRHLGRPRRLTLGRYPTIGLAKARKLASDALLEIRNGNDPQGEKRQELVAATIEHQAMFGAVLNDYVTTYLKRKTRSSTATERERLLRVDFERHWSRFNVHDITKPIVRSRLEAIVGRGTPSAAMHAFTDIRAFFNWCIKQGYLTVSPCHGLDPPAKHISCRTTNSPSCGAALVRLVGRSRPSSNYWS